MRIFRLPRIRSVEPNTPDCSRQSKS